jgi:hypothetical protein
MIEVQPSPRMNAGGSHQEILRAPTLPRAALTFGDCPMGLVETLRVVNNIATKSLRKFAA